MNIQIVDTSEVLEDVILTSNIKHLNVAFVEALRMLLRVEVYCPNSNPFSNSPDSLMGSWYLRLNHPC